VFLITELFKETVVISGGDLIYVFPIDNMPNTVFVHNVEEGSWSRWYVVVGQEATFKMALDPRGPYAKFGHIHEPWGAVAERPPAMRLPPSSFFILAYAASRDAKEFAEPKVISIRDFDRDKVRELARQLKKSPSTAKA